MYTADIELVLQEAKSEQLKNFLYHNVEVGYTLITLPSLASATASCSVISDANTFLRTFFSPLPIFPSTDAVAAWEMWVEERGEGGEIRKPVDSYVIQLHTFSFGKALLQLTCQSFCHVCELCKVLQLYPKMEIKAGYSQALTELNLAMQRSFSKNQ